MFSSASADVRITAAQALAQFGGEADVKAMLPLLADHADWKNYTVFSSLATLNSLDALGTKAVPLATLIKTMPTNGPAPDAHYKSYVGRLIEDLRDRLK